MVKQTLETLVINEKIPVNKTVLEIGDVIDPGFSTMPELYQFSEDTRYVVTNINPDIKRVTANRITPDYKVHKDEINFTLGNQGYVKVIENVSVYENVVPLYINKQSA